MRFFKYSNYHTRTHIHTHTHTHIHIHIHSTHIRAQNKVTTDNM